MRQYPWQLLWLNRTDERKCKKQRTLTFEIPCSNNQRYGQSADEPFTRLGIKEAYAIIGGSLGGMQGLCMSIEYPHFYLNIVILLATTYATGPWAIAFNKLAMEGIIKRSRFKNGNYEMEDFEEEGLLSLPLVVWQGTLTFKPHSMDKKFGRNYVETDGLYELFGRFKLKNTWNTMVTVLPNV